MTELLLLGSCSRVSERTLRLLLGKPRQGGLGLLRGLAALRQALVHIEGHAGIREDRQVVKCSNSSLGTC